jgi:hypothetical protein
MVTFRSGVGMFLLCVAACVVVFAPFLAAARVLAPGDGRVLSLPHYSVERTLWTPHIFCGFPAAADPQTFTYYPPAALLAWIPDSFNLFVLSAYVLAACFTCGYVHLLTGSRTAGVLGGVVYALSGFGIARLGHTNILHSACWLPLNLWALESLRHRTTAGGIAVGAAAIALSLLGGHPQIPLYVLALGATYVLALGGSAPAGRWRWTAAALASAVLGLGLAAVMVVPAAELTLRSARARMDFMDFVSLSLPPNQWPHLLMPGLHGGLADPFTGRVARPFGSGGGLDEATGYVGLLPWALAAVGVAVGLRRDVRVRFWLAVAVVCLLLAFGKETPLGWITFQIPIWNRFRIPARHLMEFTFALAVLAGFGVAELQRRPPAERLRLARNAALFLAALLGVAVLWFAGMVASGLYTRHMPAPLRARVNLSALPWGNPAVGVPLALLAVTAVGLWLWARRPERLGGLLFAVLLLDLGAFAWLYASPRTAFDPETLRRPETLVVEQGERVLPLQPLPKGSAPPNLTRLWGVSSVSGYCPLVLRRYSELTGINYIGFDDYRCLESGSRVLDVLATRYVLAPEAWLASPPDPLIRTALRDEGRFRRVDGGPVGIAMFENLRALPRVRLVREAVPLCADDVRLTIQTGRLPDGRPFDPAATALVEDAAALHAAGAGASTHVRIVEDSDTVIEIQTNADNGAFLVLADTDYPGWSVTVDGVAVPLVRTNYVQRGVAVPAGEHRVRFVYRPVSVAVGLAVSAACLVALAALVLVHFRQTTRLTPVATARIVVGT